MFMPIDEVLAVREISFLTLLFFRSAVKSLKNSQEYIIHSEKEYKVYSTDYIKQYFHKSLYEFLIAAITNHHKLCS